MLDGLFVTPAVVAITEALAAGAAEGKLLVVGNAKLATALATNRDVIAAGITARAKKHLANTVHDVSILEARSCAAVIGCDVTEDAQWPATLQAWARVVREGGRIVLVHRGRAAEASRRALCAGLSEIEQRHAGRAVITSGAVTHLSA